MKPESRGTSGFKGVNWDKTHNTWKARYNDTHLGNHATKEEAASAYSKFLEDGFDLVEHRAASTSQFTGVSWEKARSRWKAQCKGKYLGYHTTEEAAQAYNAEAELIGRPLNINPPAGAGAGLGAGGGAGPKRAAPKTPASSTTSKKAKRVAPTTPATPTPSKKLLLQHTSAGAAARAAPRPRHDGELGKSGCQGQSIQLLVSLPCRITIHRIDLSFIST